MKKRHSSITASLDDFFLECKISSPQLKDAAKVLQISDRRLSYRLRKAGTSYSEQLHKFRMARAFEHLDLRAAEKETIRLRWLNDLNEFSQPYEGDQSQSGIKFLSSKEIPLPRNWLERPSKFRIAYCAFDNDTYSALYNGMLNCAN